MKKIVLLIAVAMVLFAGVDKGIGEEIGLQTERIVVKEVVHAAALGLGAVAVHKDGTYDAGMIRKYVNAVRFLENGTGYFFVYDYRNNVNIAHATLRDFPGKEKTNHRDSRGMYVIRKLSEIARSRAGRGSLIYYWKHPDTMIEAKKYGYLEVIPGTTLYIGSGIYLKEEGEK
jgi:methyl-accepting chemotaxis protein